MSGVSAQKDALLVNAARKITGNLGHPLIAGKSPFDFQRWPDTNQFSRRAASYLVGIIKFLPALDIVRAVEAYQKKDCAFLVQLLKDVGWEIPAGQLPEVIATNDGALTFTIPWPAALQNEDGIALEHLPGAAESRRRGRLVAGVDGWGDLVTFSFDKSRRAAGTILHLKISGTTGAGKSFLEKLILYQIADGWRMLEEAHTADLSKKPRIVLIDMKGGDGPGILQNIPCLAGPVVRRDVEQARNALFYATVECQERYRRMEEARQTECQEPPLYVMIGEITKLTAAKIGAADPASIFMIAYLMLMGRAGNVHVIADTQYSKASFFGETTTAMQFDGFACFRTSNEYDTGVALPRGHDVQPWRTLTKPGDYYALLDNTLRRALAPYATDAQLYSIIDTAAPERAKWDPFDAAALDGFEAPKERGQPEKTFTAAQIAAALQITRHPPQGDKREALRRKAGGMGSTRIKELLELARELDAELDTAGYCRKQEDH